MDHMCAHMERTVNYHLSSLFHNLFSIVLFYVEKLLHSQNTEELIFIQRFFFAKTRKELLLLNVFHSFCLNVSLCQTTALRFYRAVSEHHPFVRWKNSHLRLRRVSFRGYYKDLEVKPQEDPGQFPIRYGAS